MSDPGENTNMTKKKYEVAELGEDSPLRFLVKKINADESWTALAIKDEDDLRELRNAISLYLATYTERDHSKMNKLRIYVNRKLNMTPNKRAAHAVHAALTAFGVHPGTKVVVLDKGHTEMAKMRTVIHDSGYTELEPGSLTASTNWPEDSDPS